MIARQRPETTYSAIGASIFSDGSAVEKLENCLLDFFKVKKVLFTQSARSGLYFLFKSLPQKRVFIPSYTCWVVVEAARLAKKEVVFVDIQLSDYNIDAGVLQKKILPHSIILITHQFGIPCDIEEIMRIADENQCYVIEDNAAAFGSEYKGKKTGSFCGASVISFELTKTLTAGRGGAILFNDEDLFKKVNDLIQAECISPGFFYQYKYSLFTFLDKFLTQNLIFGVVSFVFQKINGFTTAAPSYKEETYDLYINKLDPVFIKLALLNFKNIPDIIRRKNLIASKYFEQLGKSDDFYLPDYPAYKVPALMRYPIRLKKKDKISYYLDKNKQGLDLGFTFPYSCDPDKENSPMSEKAAATVLNIPAYSSLSDKRIQNIIDILN